MKLIYILVSILLIAITAKTQNVFLKAQTSSWYPLFLKPVVDIIIADTNTITVLDIGTGPGKLLELINTQNENLKLTGIDIDSAMINEAKQTIKHQNITFDYQKINEKLEFENETFDVITFCSVLFLLNEEDKNLLINEAIRILKPNGKIIVLTPSGKKMILSSFTEVWKYPYKPTNWTFIVWKTLTTNSARKWQHNQSLKEISNYHNLNYTHSITFNKNATIEILTKNNNKL